MKSSDFLLGTEHMFLKGKVMLEKHIRYEEWRAWKSLGNAEEVTWSGCWIYTVRESISPEEQEPTATPVE